MKAVAAGNINQYEFAVASLADYKKTVTLGLAAYFKSEKINTPNTKTQQKSNNENVMGAIVFGSDQGLVGRFNDSLTDFVATSLHALKGTTKIWAVGERIQLLLNDAGFKTDKLFAVPNAVNAITSLVDEILVKAQESMEKEGITTLYIFHNKPKDGAGYKPVMQQLLPLDEKWQHEYFDLQWPTNNLPQIAGKAEPTLLSLISEYLFVSLFKACAESLASENASRLNAMQRAEKNIEELMDDLNNTFNSLRQSSIDEELFDVVAGFEALQKDRK
jgi:F-type H+-transporting ATPase subunit gamma